MIEHCAQCTFLNTTYQTFHLYSGCASYNSLSLAVVCINFRNLSSALINILKYLSMDELKRQGGSGVKKNMLILFERFHRCGDNAFYGMSKFYSVQKLSAFQCVGPLTFL